MSGKWYVVIDEGFWEAKPWPESVLDTFTQEVGRALGAPLGYKGFSFHSDPTTARVITCQVRDMPVRGRVCVCNNGLKPLGENDLNLLTEAVTLWVKGAKP